MKPAVALLALACLAVPVAAEIHVEPERPVPGEPALFSTSVVGNVSWSFADGDVEVGRMASHAFEYPGIYRVQVLVDGRVVEHRDVEVPIPEDAYQDAATPAPTTEPPPDVEEKPGGSSASLGEWAVDHPFLLMAIVAVVAGSGVAGYRIVSKRREAMVPVYEDTDEPEPGEDWQGMLESLVGDEDVEEEGPMAPVVPAPVEVESLDLDGARSGVDEEDLRRRLEE